MQTGQANEATVAGSACEADSRIDEGLDLAGVFPSEGEGRQNCTALELVRGQMSALLLIGSTRLTFCCLCRAHFVLSAGSTNCSWLAFPADDETANM